MLDFFLGLEDWVPRVQIGLPVAFGLWALWRMRRPPVATRSDRRIAVGIALAIGVVAITAGTLVFSSLAGMFSGGPNYGVGLLFGLQAATLVPLSCLAGYTLLAARGLGRTVWLGFVLAPFVLIAGPLVIFEQIRNQAYQ